MKISEVMNRDIATIPADANLVDAATIMRIRDIGFLPVLEQDKVVGVLTDRDIVIRSICEEHNALSTKVYDVMTPTPICVTRTKCLQTRRRFWPAITSVG